MHHRDEERVIDVLQNAIARDADGKLILRPTADLQRLRANTPDLWFLVRDGNGRSLAEGAVPAMRLLRCRVELRQARIDQLLSLGSLAAFSS